VYSDQGFDFDVVIAGMFVMIEKIYLAQFGRSVSFSSRIPVDF
jgi:hypothetical protein